MKIKFCLGVKKISMSKIGLCLVKKLKSAFLTMGGGFPDFKNHFSDAPGPLAFQWYQI